MELTVEDPGVFTTTWKSTISYRRGAPNGGNMSALKTCTNIITTRKSTPDRRQTGFLKLHFTRDFTEDFEGSQPRGMVENLPCHDEFVWPVSGDKRVQTMLHCPGRAHEGAGEPES